jgi:hypothetical protein
MNAEIYRDIFNSIHMCIMLPTVYIIHYTDKNDAIFSSYIRNFRWDRLQMRKYLTIHEEALVIYKYDFATDPN